MKPCDPLEATYAECSVCGESCPFRQSIPWWQILAAAVIVGAIFYGANLWH